MHPGFKQWCWGRSTKGEVYRAIGGPERRDGVYIRSEGGAQPARVRSPPRLLPRPGGSGLVEGEMIADMVAIFASVDVVLGTVTDESLPENQPRLQAALGGAIARPAVAQ